MRLDALYPRKFPRMIYAVCGLVFLLIALNFLPLSLNYNWVKLQAAPPFRLTDEARASLDNALKLLERAKAEKKPLLFVTDDAKEDWWLIHEERTIGPRPELLREFAKLLGVKFGG